MLASCLPHSQRLFSIFVLLLTAILSASNFRGFEHSPSHVSSLCTFPFGTLCLFLIARLSFMAGPSSILHPPCSPSAPPLLSPHCTFLSSFIASDFFTVLFSPASCCRVLFKACYAFFSPGMVGAFCPLPWVWPSWSFHCMHPPVLMWSQHIN